MGEATQASPPPPYNAAEPLRSSSSQREGEAPPPYHAPTRYAIGESALSAPLVDIRQLKAHLALLRAFKSLKTNIQDKEPKELQLPPVVDELDKEKRWAWFVGLAVERYVS